MGSKTSIEWTADKDGNAGASWNPIRAQSHESGKVGWHCEIVSPGCERCYAMAINRRLGTGLDYLLRGRGNVVTYLDEKMLTAPLHWRKPRRIFVGSMTDLFGEFVTDKMLDRIFAVMALCPHHTFLLLTKRAERMRDYCRLADTPERVWNAATELMDPLWALARQGAAWGGERPWPLRNVWTGVSVEDQRRADERIPLLLDTPAAVRWISAEPLLGPADLNGGRGWLYGYEEHGVDMTRPVGQRVGACVGWTPPLDWVVVGGESGPRARPLNIDWARSIIAQCKSAGVACFVKQIGAKPTAADPASFGDWMLHDRKGGDPSEWPEDLRVREYPEPRP